MRFSCNGQFHRMQERLGSHCFAIAVIWLSAGQIESAEDTAQHPRAASTGWPPGSASKSVKHPARGGD